MIGPSHFITTPHFQVGPREDEHTNPGCYGKQLANWIAEELRAQGESVDRVLPEDFGWCVLLRADPVRFWIGCGNREESTTEWVAYVVAEASFVQRLFKRVDVRPEVERLSALLGTIVAAALGGTAYSVEGGE